MKQVIIICITCIMVTSAFAESLVDTKDNRLREAKRYLKATQPEEMMEDMAKNMAQNIPESERQEFIDLMTKHLDMKSFEKLMTDSMIKHFTAEELKALADFYSKSAMKKFGAYTADIMPHIQVEIMKAYTKAMEAKIEKKENAQQKNSPDKK